MIKDWVRFLFRYMYL